MAVPTSGTLELEELAREAYYGQYGGDPNTYPITPPIFLYDLVNGGNSAGSGMSYPTVNTGCSPNPAERAQYQAMTLQNAAGTEPDHIRYTTKSSVSDIAVGDILYTESGGVYYPTSGHNQLYWILGEAGNFPNCPQNGNAPGVQIDANGAISYFYCDLDV